MKVPAEAFGPRASITTIGVCEPLPDGTWYVAGWVFDPRFDPRLLDRGCPFVHNEQNHHIGYLGWTWEELRALADTRIELSMLETSDRRL